MASTMWTPICWCKCGCVTAVQVWVLDSMVGQAKLCAEEPRDVYNVIQEVLKISTPVPSREWVRPLIVLPPLLHRFLQRAASQCELAELSLTFQGLLIATRAWALQGNTALSLLCSTCVAH